MASITFHGLTFWHLTLVLLLAVGAFFYKKVNAPTFAAGIFLWVLAKILAHNHLLNLGLEKWFQ